MGDFSAHLSIIASLHSNRKLKDKLEKQPLFVICVLGKCLSKSLITKMYGLLIPHAMEICCF